MAQKRTTHQSRAGTKLYAKRSKTGQFTDIQTCKRANGSDVKRRAKSEGAQRTSVHPDGRAATRARGVTTTMGDVRPLLIALPRLKPGFTSRRPTRRCPARSRVRSSRPLSADTPENGEKAGVIMKVQTNRLVRSQRTVVHMLRGCFGFDVW